MKRIFIFILFFLGIINISTAQIRWYVDINGSSTGSGTSWATACSDLQLVINNASAGDTIWVAQGTYKPMRPADNLNNIDPNNRENSFVLNKNLSVYGGFSGNETNIYQRNWQSNITIFSGDIGTLNDSTDNSYHVVQISADVLVDGFTITKGNANGNNESYGGGIYIAQGTVTLSNNSIVYNTAIGQGGGIHSEENNNTVIKNNNISYNSSQQGGGLQLSSNVIVLLNNTIHNNTARHSGGMNFFGNNITNILLMGNTIRDNIATDGNGGGIDFGPNSNAEVKLVNNIIRDNNATSGAGMILRACNATFVNNLICNNNAFSSIGGGIQTHGANIVLTNNTIVYNTASGDGGGIYNNSSSLLVRNSIIWGNTSHSNVVDNIYNDNSTPIYAYSLIGGQSIGNGIILNSDPLFINSCHDYHLSHNSPCIDAGNNSFYNSGSTPDISSITTDLDNNPRFYNNGIVDLGAYEYQGNPFHITPDAQDIVYVNKHVTSGNGTGNSWTNATKELADALYAAKTNTNIKQIWVAKGTYYPLHIAVDNLCDTTVTDRDKSFLLVKDVQIYGGFAGYETVISQRNWANNPTILSGDIGITDDSTDNAYNVVLSVGNVGTACLDGFTITKGNADYMYTKAILINGTTKSRFDGGGIYIQTSSPALTNLVITGNMAHAQGGGIYAYSSSSVLTNILIYNNKCPITYGISVGGGMYYYQSSPTLTNVTIANNYAYYNGGGVYFNQQGFPKVRNCIIYGNTSGTNVVDNVDDDGWYSIPTYSHCLIGGEPLGNGIILNSDPLFVDAANGDYRLSRYSPCFNAGDNSFYHPDSVPDLSGITTDLDGNPRISAGTIDLGAYEYLLNIIPDNNGIVYVNKHVTTGNGTGNSWYNAAVELADALYFADLDTNIKQIWVAQGTYYPLYNTAYTTSGQPSTDNRDRTFVMVKNVQVYGGFPVDANDIVHTTLSTRDWGVNPVILSGDIGIVNDSTDNCYHVVVSAGDVGNACLDGFYITKGNANGSAGVFFNGRVQVNQMSGGGINIRLSSPVLNHIELVHNNANSGGGISLYSSSSLTIYNAIIRENKALYGGGIYHNDHSDTNKTSYVNCLFLRNEATIEGGAINCYIARDTSGLVFTNCTFAENSSANGNLIYYFYSSAGGRSLQFRNCIIDSLSAGNLFGGTNATIDDIVFTHTITPYSSLGNNPLNTGNLLSTDPMFLNRNTDDYRLQPSSPAVNAGNDAYYQAGENPDISSVTTDLAGRPRFNSLSVDMGAHEHQIIIEDNNGIVYVNKHVQGGNGSGNSWANAAKELADALHAAKYNSNIEQIWVAQATYIPFNSAEDGALGNGKRDNAFVLVKDVRVYGGFPTHANDIQHNLLSSRNVGLYSATLSGDIGVVGDDSDNCYHVVISAGDVGNGCLDGFVVTKGNADANTTIMVNGVSVYHQHGGGIGIFASSPSIENTIVRNNQADLYGGGIFAIQSDPQLLNLSIYKNKAEQGGGICNLNESNPLITNSLIRNNTAETGGGISNVSSSPILTNTTITENTASVSGGGIYSVASLALPLPNVQIRNSIIWSNKVGNIDSNVTSAFTTYFNCLVGGKPLGNGIILNSDPLFTDPTNNDFRLSSCSPAINVGNNDFYSPDSIPDLSDITIDLDNNPRFYNHGIIDLGVYEYQGSHVAPPSVTIENDTTICFGESIDVIFSISGGPNWDIVYTKDNGTSFDTLKNISISPFVITDNYTLTTTYQLQSITNHICNEISLSDEITITVLPEPALDNILTNDTLCDGQQTKAVVFSGADQFQWTASGSVQGLPTGIQTGNFGTYTIENKTSSQTTSTIRIIPQNTQNGISCEGSIHSFNIIASPATSIQSFTTNRSIFCEGEELDMEVSASGYLLSYQWFKDGTVINGATRNTYNVPNTSSSQSGQYQVKVSGFCGEKISNPISIRIDRDSVLVEKWDDVILVDNSTEDYIGYQWYKDGIMIPGATNQFYQELGGLNGCYKVNLTLKSGKKEMTCERCLDNVKKSLSIYPNPVKQGKSVNISLYDENQLYQGLMKTRLYSIDGKLLQKKQTNSGNSEINMSNLAVGVYILKITTEDGQSYNERIIVH